MRAEKDSQMPFLASVLLLIGGGIGAWLFYSAFVINHKVKLPDALEAQRDEMQGRNAATLSYYSDISAEGVPLVLIHSINAAASAYEVRPLFEYYRGKRPVYALDLPGFGFSDRSDRAYSIDLYKDAIADFMEHVGGEIDVVTLSLSSEFVARVALEQPHRFRSMTVLSPTGLTPSRQKASSQKASESDTSKTVHNIVSNPIWSQALYDLLVIPQSLRFFLSRAFAGEVDQGLLDYAYDTTHQPGARHAPLYFVSGQLFSPDIFETVYKKLTVPSLVLYDTDPNVSFDLLPDLLDHNGAWEAVRISNTRGLPHFERLEITASIMDEFWSAR